MMHLSLRHLWLIAVVCTFLFTAWMFRYDVTPKAIGYLRHDRWTGETVLCIGGKAEGYAC
jgi:hypothetical protein